LYSTEYDEVFALMGISGSETIRFAEFLRHLDTPPDMERLGAVLKNFIATYNDAWLEDISLNANIVQQIHQWLALAETLQERLPSDKKFRRHPHKRGLELFRGILTKSPFYPLHYLLSVDNADFFKWLRQILFVVPFIVQERTKDTERFKAYEYEHVGLFFREMTINEQAVRWLRQKDCSACKNIRSFIGWLYEYRAFFRKDCTLSYAELQRTGEKSSEDPREKIIGLYHEITTVIKTLEIIIGYQKQRRTPGTYDRRPQPHSKVTEDIPKYGVTALESDLVIQIETLPDASEQMLYSILQPEIDDELVDAGEEILEQQQDEVYLFADAEPMEAYIAAFHGRRLSKSVMRRVERQHQYLNNQQTLSNSDVYRLLHWCRKPKKYTDDQEVACITAMVFFCSMLPHQLTSTSLDWKNSDFPKLDFGENKRMALKVFTIQYAENLANESTVESLLLPLPIILLQASERHLTRRIDWFKDQDLPLGGSKYGDDTPLQDRLKLETGLSVTAHQLSSFLFLRACAMFGTACATLMFNRPAPGSQARLYYTSLKAGLLQERYKQLVTQVLQDANLLDQPAFAYDSPIQSANIGCRQAPTLQDYQSLLAKLSTKLQELRKNLLNQDWVHFHNYFTAYCIVAQGLLTGLRPTHQGFITARQILYSSKVAVVRDKDSADEYHTRTIPLHPVAIEIAEAYQAHMQAMLGRLHRIGALRKWQGIGSPEPFFFTNTANVDSSYKVSLMPFKPSLLQETLKEFFSGPPNGNRKFLRSWFESQSVPSYCIDALLGHGNLGETVWHPHNTMSLEDVRQTLVPYLDALVQVLKLKAISGLTT
jgi:hypothetical protein